MVHKRDIKKLEKRGIYTFVSTEDRDAMVQIFRNKGFHSEPLGDTMLIVSKDPKRVEKYKKLEQMTRKVLGRMVKRGQVVQKGKTYRKVR